MILVLTSCFGYGDFAVTRMKANTRMEENALFFLPLLIQSGSIYRSPMVTSVYLFIFLLECECV